MNKKIISIITAWVLLFTCTVPVYGVTIMDATINAGADRVHSTNSAEKNADKNSTEKADDGDVGCTIPKATAETGAETINEGVFAGKIDLSGLSETEAMTAVNKYISELGNTQVTLNCVSGNQVSGRASALGLYWKNIPWKK